MMSKNVQTRSSDSSLKSKRYWYRPCPLSVVSLLACAALLVRVEILHDQLSTLQNNLQVEKIRQPPGTVKFIATKRYSAEKTDLIWRARRDTKSLAAGKPLSIQTVMEEINKTLKLNLERMTTNRHSACAVGPPGIAGIPGRPGPRGRRGRKGSKGNTGSDGQQGAIGRPGHTGKQGRPGPLGPVGQKGAKGADGTPGPKGSPGIPGPRGMPGMKGDPGRSLRVPVTRISPANLTVSEKETATFYCSADGNPKPVVTWSRSGAVWTNRHVFDNSGQLMISATELSDIGKYTCSARNVMGADNSTAQLFVKVPPRFQNVPPLQITSNVGQTLTFTCNIIGYPTPVVTWRRLRNVPLPIGRHAIRGNTLTVRSAAMSDRGGYLCTGSNALGTVSEVTVVEVKQSVYSECSGYMWLTEANRRASYKGDGKCDSRLKSGWYRFSSTAGSRMPDSCVPERRCNTDASGWLSGGHPSVAEGVVTRKVCFHWSGNCCYWDNGRWKKSIRVINCGGFYVYELGPTPECSLRYCGAS